MQIVVQLVADVSNARLPLGTLQLTHFLQQIFARIYKQNSKTYLQQKYLPPPATATDQILTGNHFYNSLLKPLLWWHPVVKLFRSSPQIPIHFVFFVAFLGLRLLAVFWCFCEALAVAAEGGPIWRKHARFFPTTPNWSLRRLLRTWQTSVGLAGRQTRIWPNAKPW